MSTTTPSPVPITGVLLPRAQEIMRKNFLGPTDVMRHFGVTYTAEQIRQFAEIPYREETLHACKDTHVLIAGAPLSLNEVRTLADGAFYDTNWYNREAFANEKKVSVRGYLLRKGPVPASCGKTYDEQTALLTKEEEVPFAAEVTYMVILYWLTHRERLLPEVFVRCQDKGSGGLRVRVGGFDSGGFRVGVCWADVRDDLLGLASSVPPRKS